MFAIYGFQFHSEWGSRHPMKVVLTDTAVLAFHAEICVWISTFFAWTACKALAVVAHGRWCLPFCYAQQALLVVALVVVRVEEIPP